MPSSIDDRKKILERTGDCGEGLSMKNYHSTSTSTRVLVPVPGVHTSTVPRGVTSITSVHMNVCTTSSTSYQVLHVVLLYSSTSPVCTSTY